MKPDDLKVGERYLLSTKTGDIVIGTYAGRAPSLDGDILRFETGKRKKAISVDHIVSIQPA